ITRREALVDRKEENGQYGGPGQRNEKRLGNEKDQVSQQEQRTVREHGGQSVSCCGVSVGLRHSRYIIHRVQATWGHLTPRGTSHRPPREAAKRWRHQRSHSATRRRAYLLYLL